MAFIRILNVRRSSPPCAFTSNFKVDPFVRSAFRAAARRRRRQSQAPLPRKIGALPVETSTQHEFELRIGNLSIRAKGWGIAGSNAILLILVVAAFAGANLL